MAGARARSMQGFTLVELVVAVTILGLILVPLSAAATFFIEHGTDTTGVFADDSSIRSVISLFTTDVESAETVKAPDPAPCGGSASALATMTWTDDGTIFQASWTTQTSGSTITLVRQRCTGTSLVSTLLVADVQAPPTVSCAPSCANASTVTMVGTAANGAGFTVSAKRRPS